MAIDISGYGTTVDMIVPQLFPAGLTLTQFADNVNPVEFEDLEIAGRAMGLNGDLAFWIKPAPIDVTFSVLAETEDDNNLKSILNASRAIRGKPNLKIIIPSATITYPSGKVVNLAKGYMLSGPVSSTVESEGRFSSNRYKFTFEYLA